MEWVIRRCNFKGYFLPDNKYTEKKRRAVSSLLFLHLYTESSDLATSEIPSQYLLAMAAFGSKTYHRSVTASSSLGERIGALYRAQVARHPFLLFGLPFVAVMIAGSFALTPATALRYERHDRKLQQLSQEEALNLGLKDATDDERIKRNPRRRIVGDDREEYYASFSSSDPSSPILTFFSFFLAETDGQGPGQLGTETG